jgi:hypothetical protein
MYRFGSIDSGIFNEDHTWDSALSLDDFDGMAGFTDNDASQPPHSTRLDKAGREPNKAVSCHNFHMLSMLTSPINSVEGRKTVPRNELFENAKRSTLKG